MSLDKGYKTETSWEIIFKKNIEKKLKFDLNTYEPRSDRRDLLTIKVKSEIFTEKEKTSCCNQLQKICRDNLYK